MNFASDNGAGVAPEILDAIVASSRVNAPAYGADDHTARAQARLSDVFQTKVAAFLVTTGTAANALALSALAKPWDAVFCHEEAHVIDDECGAPEFFTHGAKLVPIAGDDAKLTPASIAAALKHFQKGFVHHAQPKAISLTQATELGTVYAPDELAAISSLARAEGLKLHVDGARFANALVGLGCTPAELSWKSGVDVLSFGATKNGALAAEAVIFFDAEAAADFEYRRKKSGHLLSKMRFVSAQLDAYLDGDHWVDNARHANALAQRLAQGLARAKDVTVAHPVQANAVFARMPVALAKKLRAAGAVFYDWGVPENGAVLARLMLSFATPEADVAKLIEAAS